MARKIYFFSCGTFLIKYGSEVRSWEDKWLGNAILCKQYLAPHNIVNHKSKTLVTMMKT
jgi:hypothetical protein